MGTFSDRKTAARETHDLVFGFGRTPPAESTEKERHGNLLTGDNSL
jgi:hypothetical protein